MAAIKRRDTWFEIRVRSLLHAAGFRYRVDFPIRTGGGRPIRPDIAFPRRRVAIFCDGCFWHGCPDHGQRPEIRNASYWTPKIAGNRERDARHQADLEGNGWLVLRFWEHEDPARVAAAIGTAVKDRASSAPTGLEAGC